MWQAERCFGHKPFGVTSVTTYLWSVLPWDWSSRIPGASASQGKKENIPNIKDSKQYMTGMDSESQHFERSASWHTKSIYRQHFFYFLVLKFSHHESGPPDSLLPGNCMVSIWQKWCPAHASCWLRKQAVVMSHRQMGGWGPQRHEAIGSQLHVWRHLKYKCFPEGTLKDLIPNQPHAGHSCALDASSLDAHVAVGELPERVNDCWGQTSKSWAMDKSAAA